MSAALAARWSGMCDRLGVKPRQFAALLGVAAVAVGALAARSALRPGRAPARPAVAAAAAPAPAPRTAAPRMPVQAPELHVRPARDPFRPFFASAGAEAHAAEPGRGADGPLGRAPGGMVLKAIIAGEYAVIGNDTVAVGDEVSDADGRRYLVEAIHERRVVLRDGSGRSELGYSVGRAAQPRPAAAAGRGGSR